MTKFPVSLRVWEPQPNAISYLRIEGGEIAAVRLQRDSNGKPDHWKSIYTEEKFPCSDYRLWAPRINDLL